MTRRVSCWMLVVALSASMMACGEEESPRGDDNIDADAGLESDAGDAGDVEAGDEPDADAPDVADEPDVTVEPDVNDEPVEVDINGIWAAKMVTSGVAEVPVVGESQSDTVSILRMDISSDGQNLTVFTETCDVSIEGEAAGVAPVIPDALVNSLPITERGGTFVDGNLVLPTIYEVRGAQNFDDLRNDPLPEDAEDPRVYDQDGDGNPGITVSVEGFISGDIYLVQRSSNALVGSQTDDGRVEGRVTWSDEQSVLGASNELLVTLQPQAEPNSDPDASYFEMVSVESTVDCATIASQEGSLFTR